MLQYKKNKYISNMKVFKFVRLSGSRPSKSQAFRVRDMQLDYL